jgi:excisionase family DNA binding protein
MTVIDEQLDLSEPTYWPKEVAAIFRVDTRTVSRWACTGKLRYFLTPGGHRRYPESALREYVRTYQTSAEDSHTSAGDAQ